MISRVRAAAVVGLDVTEHFVEYHGHRLLVKTEFITQAHFRADVGAEGGPCL